jgi:FkbM family methyltransferase
MRINCNNIAFAATHPLATLRYLRMRDCIPERVIARFLPNDPVILEAGAHNGVNTVEMAEFWPGAQIHAFEPVPAAFTELEDRASKYLERIHCYALGLGSAKGKMGMHISGDGSAGSCQSSSLLLPADEHHAEYSFVEFGKTITVDVRTIDDWADHNGIKRIDFMRLDMQGYELEALKGARSILDTTSVVQLEVSNIQLYQGAPLYPEVAHWMLHHGFRPAVKAVFRVGGNVLFVR